MLHSAYLSDLVRAVRGKPTRAYTQAQVEVLTLRQQVQDLSAQVLSLTEKLVELQREPRTPDSRSKAFQVESFRRFVIKENPEFAGDQWFEKFKEQYVLDQVKLKVYRLIAAYMPDKDSSVDKVVDMVTRKSRQLEKLFKGAPYEPQTRINKFLHAFTSRT